MGERERKRVFIKGVTPGKSAFLQLMAQGCRGRTNGTSLFLINQNPADFPWTAGILVYSLKGNMPTSVLDKLLCVHCGSFNTVFRGSES